MSYSPERRAHRINLPERILEKRDFIARADISAGSISLEAVTMPAYMVYDEPREEQFMPRYSYCLVYKLYSEGKDVSHPKAYHIEVLRNVLLDKKTSDHCKGMVQRMKARNDTLLRIPKVLEELREKYPGREIFAAYDETCGQEELAGIITKHGERMIADFRKEKPGITQIPIHNSEPTTHHPIPIEIKS